MAANLTGLSAVLNKIEELNQSEDIDSGMFRPQLLHQNPGLLDEDYREFGDWIINAKRVSYKDLNNKLVEMRKKRSIRWHVYDAPDNVIIPAKSVSLSLFCYVIFQLCDQT